MPIKTLTAEELEQTCANCGNTRVIPVESLVLGIVTGEAGDQFRNPDAIALPSCACGAAEFLMRTFDQAPAADINAPYVVHRRLVNALAQHLKDATQVHPDLEAKIANDARAPTDIAPEPSGTVPPLFPQAENE